MDAIPSTIPETTGASAIRANWRTEAAAAGRPGDAVTAPQAAAQQCGGVEPAVEKPEHAAAERKRRPRTRCPRPWATEPLGKVPDTCIACLRDCTHPAVLHQRKKYKIDPAPHNSLVCRILSILGFQRSTVDVLVERLNAPQSEVIESLGWLRSVGYAIVDGEGTWAFPIDRRTVERYTRHPRSMDNVLSSTRPWSDEPLGIVVDRYVARLRGCGVSDVADQRRQRNIAPASPHTLFNRILQRIGSAPATAMTLARRLCFPYVDTVATLEVLRRWGYVAPNVNGVWARCRPTVVAVPQVGEASLDGKLVVDQGPPG